jgi:hypothetical protein
MLGFWAAGDDNDATKYLFCRCAQYVCLKPIGVLISVDCSALKHGEWPKDLAACLMFFLAIPLGYLAYRYLRYSKKIAESRVVPPDTFFFSWGTKLFGSYTNSLSYLRFVVVSQAITMLLITAFFGYCGVELFKCPP